MLHGQANGTFTIGQTVTFPDTDVFSVETGDFNGDGLDDAVLLTRSGTRLALGTAAGGVPAGVLTLKPAIDAATYANGELTVADVDRDHRDDLIIARCCTAPLGTFVRRGRSDGTFEAPVQVFTNVMHDLTVGDLDDDGNLDILGAETYTGIAVAFGAGNGTFDAPENVPIAGIGGTFRLSALAAADMTGDGVDDIIAGDAYSYTGVMSLLRNAPYLTVSEVDLEFGAVGAGAHVARPLTIGNSGVAALNVASATAGGPGFSLDSDGCSSKRLEFGETCALALGYTGTGSDDEDAGRVVLRSDDAEAQLAFGLYGFGLPRPATVAPATRPAPPPPPAAPATVALSAADSAAAGLRVARAALRRAGIQGLRAGRVRFTFAAPAGVVRVSLTAPRSPRSGRRGPCWQPAPCARARRATSPCACARRRRAALGYAARVASWRRCA